jgi:protein-S-isoprenylcysteine O-methyltransferase Ste14
MQYWRAACLILLLTCLASFYWGVRRFFSQPSGYTLGMRLVQMSGILFTGLHIYALLASPSVTATRAALAVLVYLTAFSLFWWAQRTHGRRPLSAIFSSDVPAHLVQDGPYRFIRHPFYTSYLLAWFAGWVATAEWYILVTFLIMLAVYLRAAWLEEAKFGGSTLTGDYQAYRARTGLFLPTLRGWRRPTTHSNAH